MTDPAAQPREHLRCLRCKSMDLVQTGREPYRRECNECGQNYFLVAQLQPVEPDTRPKLLESNVAE